MSKLPRRYSDREFATLVVCIKPYERWTAAERRAWAIDCYGFRHFAQPMSRRSSTTGRRLQAILTCPPERDLPPSRGKHPLLFKLICLCGLPFVVLTNEVVEAQQLAPGGGYVKSNLLGEPNGPLVLGS